MEILKNYYPFIGIFIFLIGSIIGIRIALERKPTYEDMRKDCRQKAVCEEIHKSVDEKLNCIPEIKKTVTEIKTKIDIFLKKNGK